MLPQEVTTYFLLFVVMLIIGFEAIAYRHSDVVSTITYTVGRWLHQWPPLFGILLALVAFLLWHFYLASDGTSSRP